MREVEVTNSEAVDRHSVLRAAAERGTRFLRDEVIRPSLDAVEGEWDATQDSQGRPLLILRLRDFAGRVSMAFSPDEFADEPRIAGRLYHLYGDLLQIRSHLLLRNMLASGPAEGD